MKKNWKYLMLWLSIGAAACTGVKSGSGASADESSVNDADSGFCIVGQWLIENVVENDSSYVRPAEITPGTQAYIDFRDDNSFGIMTNCNHIGGTFTHSAHSFEMTDISTTEMACDNMDLEEMLKKVLPLVNTIDCINDSITRLNSSKGESYIVLKKKDPTVK